MNQPVALHWNSPAVAVANCCVATRIAIKDVDTKSPSLSSPQINHPLHSDSLILPPSILSPPSVIRSSTALASPLVPLLTRNPAPIASLPPHCITLLNPHLTNWLSLAAFAHYTTLLPPYHPTTMSIINAKPFRLALLQLAGLNASKANNIAVARKAVAAAAASEPKPDLIVLPEIWNSPYAVTAFREYSERIPAVRNGVETPAAAGAKEGESITAMREMAREAGVWLIGGESSRTSR